MTRNKFGSQNVKYEQSIELVAHYLLDEWLLKACFTNLHIEGLTKEFYLGPYCKKNLQLTKDILLSIMTFKDWEVPTPPQECFKKPDLFSIDSSKKRQQRANVEAYYKDLLQLDHEKKPRNMLQDENLVRGDKANKYPWFIMLVCLEDCRMLLRFFK